MKKLLSVLLVFALMAGMGVVAAVPASGVDMPVIRIDFGTILRNFIARLLCNWLGGRFCVPDEPPCEEPCECPTDELLCEDCGYVECVCSPDESTCEDCGYVDCECKTEPPPCDHTLVPCSKLSTLVGPMFILSSVPAENIHTFSQFLEVTGAGQLPAFLFREVFGMTREALSQMFDTHFFASVPMQQLPAESSWTLSLRNASRCSCSKQIHLGVQANSPGGLGVIRDGAAFLMLCRTLYGNEVSLTVERWL